MRSFARIKSDSLLARVPPYQAGCKWSDRHPFGTYHLQEERCAGGIRVPGAAAEDSRLDHDAEVEVEKVGILRQVHLPRDRAGDFDQEHRNVRITVLPMVSPCPGPEQDQALEGIPVPVRKAAAESR